MSDRIQPDHDLVVIGDGVIGLAIALACLDRAPDLRVAVVGPGGRTGGASGAAAAMLTALAEVDTDTFDDPRRAAKFDLAQRAVSRWPEWLAGHAETAGRPTPRLQPGTVVTATDPELDEPVMNAIRTAAARVGVETEMLEIRDVPGLRPRTSPPEAPALRIAGEGAIDPVEVLGVLDAAVAVRGATRYANRAVAIEDGVVALESGDRLATSAMVVANGAHASPLLDSHTGIRGRVPRVRFGTGVGVRAIAPPATPLPVEVVRTPHRPDGRGVYYAPHGGRRFYVGATCEVDDQPREQPRLGALRTLLDSAMDDLSTELGLAECRPVVGHRPVSADGAPLLGRATDTVWVATGTHRDGLVSAPSISALMADEIVGGVDALPPELRPCRATVEHPA